MVSTKQSLRTSVGFTSKTTEWTFCSKRAIFLAPTAAVLNFSSPMFQPGILFQELTESTIYQANKFFPKVFLFGGTQVMELSSRESFIVMITPIKKA